MRTVCYVLLAFTLLLARDVRVAVGAGDGNAISHRFRTGDSVPLLAAEYYGDRDHAGTIRLANQLGGASVVAVGQTLKIPLSSEIVTAPGDSFEGLAATYLDDARRATLLADWNRLRPTAGLAAGMVLRVPVVVTLQVTEPETLSAIATRYLGDPAEAAMLRTYNFLDHDDLAVGESLLIPLPRIVVREDKLPERPADAQARVDRRVQAETAAAAALPAGRAAWRRGDFAEVKRELTPLDRQFINRADASEAGILLASAYVLLGDMDSALATFTSVRMRAPGLRLDHYHYAPSICRAWVSAGGQLKDEP